VIIYNLVIIISDIINPAILPAVDEPGESAVEPEI